MSYILDALRKSERQRQIGEVPRIHTVQDGYTTEPAGRNPWILIAVIAILANISIGGWFWWQHQQTASSGGVAPPPAPAQALPTTLPATPVAATTPDSYPGVPAASHAAPVSRPPAAPRQIAPDLDDVVVFESIKTPSAPAAAAAQRFPDLVDISQLPASLQLAMLTLKLNVHVYDERPSERFVLIDMKRYAEGHALPQGPVIEAITPDGVVLAYQGQRFLLPRN